MLANVAQDFKKKYIARKIQAGLGSSFCFPGYMFTLPKKFRRPSEDNRSNPVRGAPDLPVFRLLNFLTHVAFNYRIVYGE